MKNAPSAFTKLLRLMNLSVLFMVLTFSARIFAQTSPVDLSYDLAVGNGTSNLVVEFTEVPGGKSLVFGFYEPFNTIGSVSKNKIARINGDGTLDATFNCQCQNFSYINSAVVQPDGKYLVAGGTSFNRLLPGGSIDSTFTNPFTQTGSSSIKVFGVAPDGKIYASLSQSGFQYFVETLYRLNSDGSIDNSFQYLSFDRRSARELLSKLVILPDGKVMIAGKYSFGFLFRLNTNGTQDISFESAALGTSQSSITPYAYDFGFQSDGKIVFIGSFETVNGIARQNLARLNANGSLDQTFSPSYVPTGRRLKVLSDNKILLDTLVTFEATELKKLNPDGSLDASYTAGNIVQSWLVLSNEDVLVFRNISYAPKNIGRLKANGAVDPTFQSSIVSVSGSVSSMGVQPDGKLIMGATNLYVKGIYQAGLVRLNIDGTIDTTFNAGTAANASTGYRFAFQPDGKILVGGQFTAFNGTARTSLVRLNADGSVDGGFNPSINGQSGAGSVYSVVLQPDGKILIGGSFTSVNGSARSSIARLNSDGTLDAAYNTVLTTSTVNKIILQPDGKILIGGSFTAVNGVSRANLARVNSDGSLDTTFAASVSALSRFVRQPDGKILYVSSNPVQVKRLNADGSADSGYSAPVISDGSVGNLILDDNGNVIVVGTFTIVGDAPRRRIFRLNSTGQLDTLFFPIGADNDIYNIVRQNDGRFIVGGNFSSIENVERSSVARITSSVLVRAAQFDYDGDGRADIGVYRPSNSNWYQLVGQNYQFTQKYFGTSEDLVASADFDGDGKTDLGIFRPSTGTWWYTASTASGAFRAVQWGQSGDIPLPSDIDGDGKADYVVFRPANSTWYRLTANNQSSTINFGLAGDKPLIGDFDGDGKADPAIYRPSTGAWWYAASSANNAFRATQWGNSTDIPVPADYDGDGKTDFAVFRPSNGGWYILNSVSGTATSVQFGLNGDMPATADYDGDGKADIAVFRPSTGAWYLLRTTAGFGGFSWGTNGDIPIPGAFIRP